MHFIWLALAVARRFYSSHSLFVYLFRSLFPFVSCFSFGLFTRIRSFVHWYAQVHQFPSIASPVRLLEGWFGFLRLVGCHHWNCFMRSKDCSSRPCMLPLLVSVVSCRRRLQRWTSYPVPSRNLCLPSRLSWRGPALVSHSRGWTCGTHPPSATNCRTARLPPFGWS